MSTLSKAGTALITGASTGIGSVYAHRLAQRGYDLILVARDQQRLTKLAKDITAKTGRKAETLPADLTVKADLKRVEERLRSDRSLTALVNNAGFGGVAKLIDSNVDDMDNMVQLNVTALTRLTSAALPALTRLAAAALPGCLERSKRLIINISSIVALSPELLNGVYSGTKAFVVNLTQSLHNEVKDKGIKVQAVLPGATSTEFWDRAKLPVHNLPADWVMTAEEMVDASLAGLDQGELITIPALPEIADWEKFDEARKALAPNLSRKHSAVRYGISA